MARLLRLALLAALVAAATADVSGVAVVFHVGDDKRHEVRARTQPPPSVGAALACSLAPPRRLAVARVATTSRSPAARQGQRGATRVGHENARQLTPRCPHAHALQKESAGAPSPAPAPDSGMRRLMEAAPAP
jgi:hypothetical protein